MKVKVLVIAALFGLFVSSISMADMNNSMNNNGQDTSATTMSTDPSASTDPSTDTMATQGGTPMTNDGAQEDEATKDSSQPED